MRAAAVTPITARTVFCLRFALGGLGAKPVGLDEITVFQAARECAGLLDRSSLTSLSMRSSRWPGTSPPLEEKDLWRITLRNDE
jgi:hypothetical protein